MSKYDNSEYRVPARKDKEIIKDLLEALIQVESLFGTLAIEDLPNTPNTKIMEMIRSLENARKVIAKATGK